MAKVGYPEEYREDFHPQDFINQSKQGRNIKQIAKAWNVARSTIYDWGDRHPEFAYTIKIGQELCEAWYIDLGQAAMMGQAKVEGKTIKVDLGWYVWMTKNICKWSDSTKLVTKDITPPENKVVNVKMDLAVEVKSILEKLEKEY